MQNSQKLKFFLVLVSLSVVSPYAHAKEKKEKSPATVSAPAPISSAAELKTKLELTDEQNGKAEIIFADQAKAISGLGESPDAAAVSKIQEETKTKVDAILTPEQKDTLAKLMTPAAPAAKKAKKSKKSKHTDGENEKTTEGETTKSTEGETAKSTEM